ncbi:hypothetical protein E2P81_ATG01871 [Venturia nashicola]|uniref:Uncharacterized protein n=1 Tax=Venturia nashicola TaxID=86259 RepID=A0A4Z1PCK6_9PEZI|nr:hypothetical protein E6O75_ATG01915 [Venturia nashicola]TLD35568.1 hypothetical protein E2P81_ATG01871 [Venturia nashicola]
MRFQTLLPAILFAQSSYAYTCCFVFLADNASNSNSKTMTSGSYEYWNPALGCEILVYKHGPTCKQWTFTQVKDTCKNPAIGRIAYIGIADPTNCA